MTQKEREEIRLRAEIFKALGHPTRLWIVERLIEGPCCVADLANEVEDGGLSAVSQHLGYLRQMGIVRDKRKGRQIYYSLTFPCIAEICMALGCKARSKPSPLKQLVATLPTLSAALLVGVFLSIGVQSLYWSCQEAPAAPLVTTECQSACAQRATLAEEAETSVMFTLPPAPPPELLHPNRQIPKDLPAELMWL